MRLITRIATVSAVGGALVAAAAGPAGATTIGLLKVSQLPSGYTKVLGPTTISASTLAKDVKKIGGGVSGFTSSCKGAPTSASLAKSSVHLVAFTKVSGTSPSTVAETVIQTPSAAVAEKYLKAAKTSAAKCTATENLTIMGTTVKLTVKTHNVTINKEGADDAVSTVLGLSGKFASSDGSASFGGSLGIQTYRKGADLIEVLVENIGVKASGSSGTITFSSGSTSLANSLGKAAIKDL